MRTGNKGERQLRPRAEDAVTRSFRVQTEENAAIRELSLKRRRSQMAWIYLVYQAHRKGRGRALAEHANGGLSALPSQKRRHIQGRLQFEVTKVFV
jgi:hypothetical protein